MQFTQMAINDYLDIDDDGIKRVIPTSEVKRSNTTYYKCECEYLCGVKMEDGKWVYKRAMCEHCSRYIDWRGI